jgi:hypothetical protein
MYPELGYTVVVLSNYDGGTREVIGRAQMLLTGGQLPQASPVSSDALKIYAGQYKPALPANAPPGPRMPPITISAEADGLRVNLGMPGQPAHRVLARSADEFFDEQMPQVRLKFAKDKQGRVASLTLSGAAPTPITASRLP